ncbi:hypothetical protein QT196_23725 [Streptomyces sp. P9-2B-2]|uniref:hypothetical protein n=1 Tax=Streptomyces sp. P9-2B-2 TaxID=3057114 RepID=UPI0025B50598|nr:hypothetical protein [Streptomyces sp. P9-2B-2]WJY40045.1 hypothetical protein QT196_23725 [Streptomyces sp. P9-2B-2]
MAESPYVWALKRVTVWTAAVTLMAALALAFHMILDARSAAEVYISGELVLSGFLIMVGGLGDLLCAKEWPQHWFGNALLVLSCIGATGYAVLAYVMLRDLGAHTDSKAIMWATSSFGASVFCGTSSVWLAASTARSEA